MICHLWFVESFFPCSAPTILLKRRIHYKDHHLLFRNCFVLKRCFCMCVCVCVLCSLTSNCKDSEPFGPFSLTEMTAHDSYYQSTRIYCPVSSINSFLNLYALPTIQKKKVSATKFACNMSKKLANCQRIYMSQVSQLLEC